jgi:DinB superfamily
MSFTYQFHSLSEYALGIEDLSKTQSSPQEQSMLEPAVITPSAFTVARPQAGEYAPYYERYVSLVEGEDILNTLDHQRREMMLLLSCREEEEGNFRYAPEKWSAKEVLGHICDTERIFAYRALRIARADATPLEGFEQDDYVRNGGFAQRPVPDLGEEFIAARRATISLLRNLDEAAWMRRGLANKNEVSVRALAYIIAGHELHHRRILEEKYFAGRP